jgi:hypothetical protein
VIPNNILKSNFVAILPTNIKKNTRTAKFFIRFLSVCVLFGGQKYESCHVRQQHEIRQKKEDKREKSKKKVK